jgi:hypothetical protein
VDEIPKRFIVGSRMYCPWCREWDAFQAFIALQTPPGHENHCPPIFKHGGQLGCKKLFSLYEEA